MVTTLTTCGVNESGALLKESMSIRPEAIGKIIMFAGTTAPEGTLYCNGAALSRTTYSELFAAIGTTYGAGDGSTTFNIPDLRDKWALFAGVVHGTSENLAEGLPNITGVVSALYANTRGEEHSGALDMVDPSSGTIQIVAGNGSVGLAFNAHNSNAIYGASAHVTPASVALLPCIIYE